MASDETRTTPQPRGGRMTIPPSTRSVTRPTPKAQTEDPRAFQLGQIQRRFKPKQSDGIDGSSVFTFLMQPSDPDFPYEIEALECILKVPTTYPHSGRPQLSIQNKDVPRGFQINIERGFDSIARENPNATLLGLMNRLDKQLETILAGRMTETIKIVAHREAPPPVKKQENVTPETREALKPSVQVVHSPQELAAAQKTRAMHVRQIEARFSRLQPFTKSNDGLTYTLPLDSPKRSTWPASLQTVRSVKMAVPQLYPLQPAEVQLGDSSSEARAVENAFRDRSVNHPDATLTQQINYLTQNLKEMSALAPAQETIMKNTPTTKQAAESPLPPETVPHTESSDTHIQYIPRPPEWSDSLEPEDVNDDGSSISDTGSDEEEAAEDEITTEPLTSSAPAERGILISFPHLELHGIELLELSSLQLTVKCERCKDTMDISRLRSSSDQDQMRQESCKKCAAGFAIRFRADMIHANSVRAGYLDLEGCTIVDLLPSNFIPTCSECSTALPVPGVVAVRGDSALSICRECHRKMSFRISEVKFLQVSGSASRMPLLPGRKKARENLGITAGSELPQRGRCSHYKKSYRWFRFQCCNKVFACDRCHDEKTDHPNEWANRMLCGFCSREQNFRPEDCGICHASLTGKRGTGFWEGGKGTRDPRKMSRKDPRKYKRKPGTKPST